MSTDELREALIEIDITIQAGLLMSGTEYLVGTIAAW
jgi:hypothetical protein